MIKTHFGHCQLQFKNGFIVSIFNGYGSWTKDGLNPDRAEPVFNSELTWGFSACESDDCEVAVISPTGRFVTSRFVSKRKCRRLDDTGGVLGYASPDEVADIIRKVKMLPM